MSGYDDPAYVLAMLALQSERYSRDPEYARAAREVMAMWQAGARLTNEKRPTPEGIGRTPGVAAPTVEDSTHST